MNDQAKLYKNVVNEYTDLLIDEFVSFVDAPLFNGKTFIEMYATPEDREQAPFDKRAMARLIEALVGLRGLVSDNGVLRRGEAGDESGKIRGALKCVPKGLRLEDEVNFFPQFLSHPVISAQLDSVPLYQAYLRNSIAYDVFVVMKFLSPEATLQGLLSGRSIAKEVFHLPTPQIFDHYESRPLLLRLYGQGFASSHFLSDIEFIRQIEFEDGDLVADIGGGFGHLGELILSERRERLDYTCLDLAGLRLAFAKEIHDYEERFAGRFHFLAGDFFQPGSVIKGIEGRGFDKLFLGWILHDWNDEQCLEVLRKCRSHMEKGAELYIFEVLPNERRMSFTFTDWLMLVMAEGHERTADQYRTLFEKAGLALEQIYKTSSARSMMKVIAHG